MWGRTAGPFPRPAAEAPTVPAQLPSQVNQITQSHVGMLVAERFNAAVNHNISTR